MIKHLGLVLFLVCLFVACVEDGRSEYRMTDDEFQHLMLDLEVARETTKTASSAVQDSLYQIYFGHIASCYKLSQAEIINEIKLRIASDEHFGEVFDKLSERIDSLTKKEPKKESKIENKPGQPFKRSAKDRKDK